MIFRACFDVESKMGAIYLGACYVLYESQTGFTKRYAEWIAESLGAVASPLRGFSPTEKPEVLIFGGGVQGSEISGLKRFQGLLRQHREATAVCFATGLRPSDETGLLGLCRYNEKELGGLPLFYFEGGLRREELASSQRFLLTIYRSMLRRRSSLRPAEEELLRRMSFSDDYSSKEQIAPLIAFVTKKSSLSGPDTTERG